MYGLSLFRVDKRIPQMNPKTQNRSNLTIFSDSQDTYQSSTPSGLPFSIIISDVHGLHPRLLISWTTSWSRVVCVDFSSKNDWRLKDQMIC